MENPSTASTAVNRTSDLGVRYLSCNSVNQDANESSTISRSRSRNAMDTFGYGIRTKIGAWNIRSLYGEGRYEQLERKMLCLKISILGISETKWRGRTEYRSDTGQTRMLYSGEDERESGQRLHGAGIMLNKVARRSLISWAPISEGIMTARFRSRIRNITIVQCYAPTNEATEKDKTAFYTHLNSVYSSVPRADNHNRYVRPQRLSRCRQLRSGTSYGKKWLGSRNENGGMLVDFCNADHLVIGGTVFKHKTCNKVTWVLPDGHTENQIEYIMIQQRWRKSMCDVRNIRNADVGSNPHLVVMSLNLKTAAVL
ncbi:craniofacial development protein 2-like [Eupeodes corollae]|uniref:craniofacial development protein 2-like n=1 Tax=Eupeodes corollae TaxID=290404 RepID=UPI0024907E87|nr:craniofacial development protein 2-like [Eupeodes corollae]